MFNDIDTAAEEMAAFKNSPAQMERRSSFEFDVTVLSAAAWPSYPEVPVNVPLKISRAMERFESFYKSKHEGRGLTWKHQLAYCQLNANFDSDKKNLVVSSFQAIVLLLFNDLAEGESLDYREIKKLTGLCK